MVHTDEGFSEDEIAEAFVDAEEHCECCDKKLAWENRSNRSADHRSGVWGRWEAHHGSRPTPVILCVGWPEECHLMCGHDGDSHNEGITPRVHKGG